MMQSAVPQEITYNRVRMRGYYTKYTQWPVYPNSSNQYWNNDQIVRFQIDLKQKGTVVDPYRSHIQFTVTVNQQMFPVGGVQVDGSAQSFISQSVMSSNAVQIQRIAQYDTLAQILTDLGFSQYVCQARNGQGLGFSNIPTHQPYSTNGSSLDMIIQENVTGDQLVQTSKVITTNVILPFCLPLSNNPISSSTVGGPPAFYNFMGVGATHVTSLNPFWNTTGLQSVQQKTGGDWMMNIYKYMNRWNNVRAQYVQGLYNKTYPDSNATIVPYSARVLGQDFDWTNLINKGFNPKNPYSIQIPDGQHLKQIVNGYQTQFYVPTNTGTVGYTSPISPEYCRGTLQPFLSPTVPQVGMQNGIILTRRVPLKQKTFRVPLISSILGVLIPPDQFTLIPLQSLNNLILQLTLSRYAMFTSGYNDVHQMDSAGMNQQQRRQWLLSQFSWNLHLYSFNQPGIVQMIQTSLTKTIALTSYGYALSSSYQITNGANVKGQYNIAAQYQSLCQIYCVFLSNQYQNYSFCRKQFRLSNNVTQLQFRINTDFFPIQPITGNAGNPQTMDTTGDNWNYYQQILLSNNFLFNTNTPNPKINTKNFAINGRPYNVKNNGTLYDRNMYNNKDYKMSFNSFNFQTAFGMSRFHQNRYVGKALYCYSWQPYGHSKNYLNGLNTTGTRNFQVIFNTMPQPVFPTDQTLYIFSKYNQVTVYTKDGIQVYGK